MSRNLLFASLLGAAALAGAAHAQDVAVAQLSAPDLFSNAGRDTGLPPTLWTGASAGTLRAVLPLLSAKPLSPAASALARRVLATGANGPEGAGQDTTLAGQRAGALVALGDLRAATAILSRTAGVERNPQLSQATAEAALLSGNDAQACQVSDRLTVGRDDVYWLRLRSFCQAKAGQADAAQLTFELAQTQAKDATYARLMGAKLTGALDAPPATLRNGLDYALMRDLGLDTTKPTLSPAVNAALSSTDSPSAIWLIEGGPGEVRSAMAAIAYGDLARARQIRGGLVQDQIPDATILDLAILDALLAVGEDKADGPTLDRLIERGLVGDAKARARAQSAALILAAYGAPLSTGQRGEFAQFTAGEAKVPPARAFALDRAGEDRLMGEAALIALWISADAGAAGPAVGDRARIIRALKAAGLAEDARAFAIEGLLALR